MYVVHVHVYHYNNILCILSYQLLFDLFSYLYMYVYLTAGFNFCCLWLVVVVIDNR